MPAMLAPMMTACCRPIIGTVLLGVLTGGSAMFWFYKW
jgi:hypothetical protein